MSQTTFKWNNNDFCQLFRHTKNAEEFISVWQQNTTFNKVTQSSEPVSAVEIDPEEQPSSDAATVLSQSSAKKRSAEEVLNQNSSKKHCASRCSPLDESIETKKVGKHLFNLKFNIQLIHAISSGLMVEFPVCNSSEPAQSRLLRKVDNVFVEGLKMRLKEDPSGPGVPPLAIACKDVGIKEVFQNRHKDVYNYEVLGGAKARQAVLTEHPEETVYAHVHCMVYCGLTDEGGGSG